MRHHGDVDRLRAPVATMHSHLLVYEPYETLHLIQGAVQYLVAPFQVFAGLPNPPNSTGACAIASSRAALHKTLSGSRLTASRSSAKPSFHRPRRSSAMAKFTRIPMLSLIHISEPTRPY